MRYIILKELLPSLKGTPEYDENMNFITKCICSSIWQSAEIGVDQGVATDIWPRKMEVDYVRMYEIQK